MFAHKTRMMKSQINDIDQETENHDTFLNDVINGLTQSEKTLPSKYFYNAEGDVLFQKIMHCDDYYLTRSEMDIFKNKTEQYFTIFATDRIFLNLYIHSNLILLCPTAGEKRLGKGRQPHAHTQRANMHSKYLCWASMNVAQILSAGY